MVIDIPVIKDLALTASLGVAVLIFTNLILLPVLLQLRRRERRRGGASAAGRERGRRATRPQSPVRRARHASSSGAGRSPRSSPRPCCSAGGYLASRHLKIGDLDPGAPELRADSRYNRDNAYITGHYSLSSDTFAVIVKTEKEGCLKYQTLVEADRLAWALQQVPGRADDGVR